MVPWTTVIGNTIRSWWSRHRGAGDAPASPSRRALLTGGGAMALGAGVTGAAVGEYTSGPDVPPPSYLDARRFGAVGDGATDDTRALQKALDAAGAAGGLVLVPAGVYLTRRLVLHSNVHLRGAGSEATVLRLHPGANSALLETADFGSLTGTDSTGGAAGFSVRDLTLDGNKAANPTGGAGLRIYGCRYELSELIVVNCRQDGVYSEWGTSAAMPAPSHQMEARLTGLRVHDNEGDGFSFRGPHDSMFVNCLAFQNQGAGFRIAGHSNGTSLVNCHGWGVRQAVPFDLAANGVGCVSCYADLNGGIGVRISHNEIRWVSGFVLGANHTGDRKEIGIQFQAGAAGDQPSGCVVDSKIVNCATAGVDFGAGLGARSTVRASLTQPGVHTDGQYVRGTGAGWIGTPHPSCRVEIVAGVADAAKNLVVSPAFEMRAQEVAGPPGAGSVRMFVQVVEGRTQLCAQTPDGVVHVLAAG